MLTIKCESCDKSFNIRDAIVDNHWNTWTSRPAYCYCPYCNEVIKKLNPGSVEFANAITFKNTLVLISFLMLSLLSVATNTLNTTGPLMVIVFGLYLAIFSIKRDHRIIGWILILLFSGIFIGLNLNV